jgi:hypothetical protein
MMNGASQQKINSSKKAGYINKNYQFLDDDSDI